MGKKSSKFDERFMKHYDQNRNKGYIPELNVENPKKIIQSS